RGYFGRDGRDATRGSRAARAAATTRLAAALRQRPRRADGDLVDTGGAEPPVRGRAVRPHQVRSPSAGKTVEKLSLPEGSRLISVMRDGKAEIAVGSTELKPGDQVLAILQPGKEDELRQILLKK